MKENTEHWFAIACEQPFSFLVQKYGFSGPIETRGGNEFTVSYTRKNKTVSISIEPFSSPIVELFYPTTELKNRRIPRQTILPPDKNLKPEEKLVRDLYHCAAELEANERIFLLKKDDF